MNFFMQMRQRNPRFGSSFANMFGLALYKWGAGKAVHCAILFLGLACHPANVQYYMKDLAVKAPDPTAFLKEKKQLLCFADNFNEYLSTKCQDGKAGEMRNFCVVYSMKMFPLPEVLEMMYPVDEGQPEISFLDQNVPAPVFMLPYELINNDSSTLNFLITKFLITNMRGIA